MGERKASVATASRVERFTRTPLRAGSRQVISPSSRRRRAAFLKLKSPSTTRRRGPGKTYEARCVVLEVDDFARATVDCGTRVERTCPRSPIQVNLAGIGQGSRKKVRTIGLHFGAAEAIGEYIKNAGIVRGALFRPRSGPRSSVLASRLMTRTSMHLSVRAYVKQLPGGMVAREEDAGKRLDGLTPDRRCLLHYLTRSPKSVRASVMRWLIRSCVERPRIVR